MTDNMRTEEVKALIVEVEKRIANLPTAPVFSELSILEKQVAVKRRELQCPVCLEESAPPT